MASAKALSRKAWVGIFVIGIHVLLGIGFIAVTAIKAVVQDREKLDAALIKHEDEPPPKEPPPPPPDFKPPVVQAPMVDIPTVVAPPAVHAVVAEPPKPAPVAKPAPPPVTAAHVAKGLDLGSACAAYYPSASKRLSEEGSVVLLVYVAPNGKVSETKVESSSGIQRLDEAAVKCVTQQGRFEPQKVGNEAVGSWQRMKWVWRLTS
jgi:protein TonB